MRNLIKIILGIVSLFLLSGCSTLYGVKYNTKIDTIKYNSNLKDITTGTTHLFLDDGENEYSWFSKYLKNPKSYTMMAFYENNNNVYFRYKIKSYGAVYYVYYGITQESKNYDFDPDFNLKDKSRIPVKNIKCIKNKFFCKVLSKKTASIIIVKEGDSGDIDFDFLNYKKIRNKYLKAIKTYDYSLVSNYKNTGVKQLLPIQLFKNAIKDSNTLAKLQTVKKIAEQENIVLPRHQYIVRKNQIIFNKKYNYYLTKASEQELNKLLKNSSKLVGVSKEKITTLQKLRRKYKYQRILNTHSITTVQNYYNRTKNKRVRNHLINLYRKQGTVKDYLTAFIYSNAQADLNNAYQKSDALKHKIKIFKDYYTKSKNQKIKKYLIDLYRQQGTAEGYMDAYVYSKTMDDIKNAYKKSSTLSQKMKAEKMLASTMKEKMFDIIGGKNGPSKLSTQTGTVLGVVSGASLTSKDFVKSFTVKSDFLEYGTYNVKIKFLLEKHYFASMFGIGTSTTETDYKVVTFKLSPKNHYRQTKIIRFEKEPASMRQSIGGVNMFSAQLQQAKLTYKLMDVK